jgi:hypothetical protein
MNSDLLLPVELCDFKMPELYRVVGTPLRASTFLVLRKNVAYPDDWLK